jgi:Cupin domain.
MNYLKFGFIIIGSVICFTNCSSAQSKDTTTVPKAVHAYTIENCVNEFNINKIEETKAGYQYWFADKNFAGGRTVKMSVVGAGLEVHPPKANPSDEFIFVLEGKGEFYLDGKTKIVGPMTTVFYPANVPCGIKNIGTADLKYLVIRAYDKTK